jgi:RND family efflux transporter MFP subunit
VVKVIRQLFLSLVIVAVAGGGIWYGSSRFLFKAKQEQPDPIETVTVEVRPIEQVVYASGEITAEQATDIRSEVSGRIDKVNVKMGDIVKDGDPLVELNSADTKSEHDEAELQLNAARIRREKMSLDFERKKTLRAQSFVVEKDFQDADIDLRLADNEIQIDRARLQTIGEKLAKTTIHAPHNGTVLNVKVRPGIVVTGAESAGESTLLMQVADLAQLQVQTEINEVDVIKVSRGMAAQITFDSLPGVTAKGKVESVSLSALAKDKDKSIRVFPIVIALEPCDAPIKSGITANVAISTARNPKAVTVVATAVFFDGNQPLVFVEKDDGEFEKRPVELGITDHVHVEIKKGLKEGEKVALQRPPGFSEG